MYLGHAIFYFFGVTTQLYISLSLSLSLSHNVWRKHYDGACNYYLIRTRFKNEIRYVLPLLYLLMLRNVHVTCALIVCLGFIVPLKNFFTHIGRHHYQLKAANFDLCSALMVIEQWGFFSVPQILWHGATLYESHLRGPVTLTPIAERLAVKLSLPIFTT